MKSLGNIATVAKELPLKACTIKEESRSGRIGLDLGDPLARSAPQGLHLECRHGTCTRARETVGYLW